MSQYEAVFALSFGKPRHVVSVVLTPKDVGFDASLSRANTCKFNSANYIIGLTRNNSFHGDNTSIYS